VKEIRTAATRRRSVLAGITAVALAVTACGSGSSATSGSSGGTIKIGSILGTSGVAASYGQQLQQGQDLAVAQINDRGGANGHKVDVEVKNSNYTPSQALAAFRGFVADTSVVSILGPNDSTDAAATTPLANSNSIVSLVQGAAAAWPVPFGKNVFLLPAGNTEVINNAVKAAAQRDRSIKKVAVLYASDETYAVTAKDAFQAAAKDNGLTVAAVQDFASSSQDFSGQLTTIKNSGAQAILVSAVAANLGVLLQQAQNLGLAGVQWVGDAGTTDPSWAKTAGASGNGVLTALPFLPTLDNSKVTAFVSAFKAKYGSTPTLYNAYGYDSANAMIQAIKDIKGDVTRAAVQQSLAKITFEGVTGTFHFPDGSGNAAREALTVVEMKDGAFVSVP